MSSAMSAAEHVVMAAVICVSLGVMVAVPFRPTANRIAAARSGKQRRGSGHGGTHIGHARGAAPEDDTRATQARQPPDRDCGPGPAFGSGGHTGNAGKCQPSGEMTIDAARLAVGGQAGAVPSSGSQGAGCRR